MLLFSVCAKTDLDGRVPVVVEVLLSVLVGARPAGQGHQVPTDRHRVAPNPDPCGRQTTVRPGPQVQEKDRDYSTDTP